LGKDKKMLWYFRAIKKYAVFKNRARRKEYWFFFLFNVIITLILSEVFNNTMGFGNFGFGLVLYPLYLAFIILPALAVGVRRMHDVGKSGWWLIVPIINLVFALKDSEPYENKYGSNPKDFEPKTNQSIQVWKMRVIIMGIAWLASVLFQLIAYQNISVLVEFPVMLFSLVIFELMFRTRKWLKPATLVVYIIIVSGIQPYILNLFWYFLNNIRSIFESFKLNPIEWYSFSEIPFLRNSWKIVYPIIFILSAYLLIQTLKTEKKSNQDIQ